MPSSAAAKTLSTKKELAGSDVSQTLSAVTSFLIRAMPMEVEALSEAVAMCGRAADLSRGNPEKQFLASQAEGLVKLFMGETVDAGRKADDLTNMARTPAQDGAAMKLKLRTYFKEGE